MTLTMTFDTGKADDNPLARFSWRRVAVAWADESGPLIRTALKNAAPVGKGPRAGRLRDAIRYERASSEASVTLKFSSNVPYLPYVLGGTRPHVIQAKAARALHWTGPGGDMFRRKVNHPGTKANPFPEKAVPALVPLLRERLEAAVREAMEGL